MASQGKLFIISGPAGVGKTTIANALLDHISDGSLVRSVTATTRPPRQNEIDGQHYHFISEKKFLDDVNGEAFLEYAFVHGKYYYGSLKNDVIEKISKGINVILVIDVQGFLQILGKNLGIEMVSIFIKPSNLNILEERLRKRASESDCEIKKRMYTAENEISFADHYKYVVASGSREHDFHEVLSIYTKESHEDYGR
jgi:guanylate kinase